MTEIQDRRVELLKALDELRGEILPDIFSSALILKQSDPSYNPTPDAIQRTRLQLHIFIEKAISIISNTEDFLFYLKRISLVNKYSLSKEENFDSVSKFYKMNSIALHRKRESLIDDIRGIIKSRQGSLDVSLVNLCGHFI
ncbi:hypothetical protein MDAP_002805 [Mitosporidium daphniae]|uniref:Uncharacterized protein n=1 Tax=Mitosporidium daphniae TaxID=1485682 RepID=A0A098VUH9_9MICR|nr:uncharacterized protein DI09_151p30 [Mitosporidium daphniae]KGG52610.1 hypothetical protein DI09_151p30 [Mitosporidium daphniae]|eukprot:XP_013239046.1 uncharacterized protein DI09_151p30 [Mitosporidium daphniae]